jgi:hypothetical protein
VDGEQIFICLRSVHDISNYVESTFTEELDLYGIYKIEFLSFSSPRKYIL